MKGVCWLKAREVSFGRESLRDGSPMLLASRFLAGPWVPALPDCFEFR